MVFFNERFELVNEGTALRVTQAGDNAPALVLPNIKASKNGYAYVYLSNPPVGGQAENAEPVYGACPDKRSGSGMTLRLLMQEVES